MVMYLDLSARLKWYSGKEGRLDETVRAVEG